MGNLLDYCQGLAAGVLRLGDILPHTATVRALRDCRWYAAHDPPGFLRSHPDIAFEVARLLSRRASGG